MTAEMNTEMIHNSQVPIQIGSASSQAAEQQAQPQVPVRPSEVSIADDMESVDLTPPQSPGLHPPLPEAQPQTEPQFHALPVYGIVPQSQLELGHQLESDGYDQAPEALAPWQPQPQPKFTEPSTVPSADHNGSRFVESFPAPVTAPTLAADPTPTPSLPVSSSQDPNDFNELQDQAKLAESRVRLMDTTIDILFTMFNTKYDLDKSLEKVCSRLLKSLSYGNSGSKNVPASAFEIVAGPGDDCDSLEKRELEENLAILAGSEAWVVEHMLSLRECLDEKQKNIVLAGAFVDEKSEKKKEKEQVKQIEKLAVKIMEMVEKRKEKEKWRCAMRAFKGKMPEVQTVQMNAAGEVNEDKENAWTEIRL